MAKVKFSALISEMRNKLNGSVFSKNRAGNYLRNKVTPVNPQSSAQVAVRALLATLAATFRTLTQAQIASWNSAVSSWQTTDIFGDAKTPSGINLYTRLNMNLLGVGVAALTVPPIPSQSANPQIDGLLVDISDSDFEISSALAAVPANHIAVIESTGPQSAGKNFVKSEFRKIHQLAAAATFPYNAWAQQVAKFGTPVAGEKFFVRVKFVNTNTGQVSQYNQVSTVAIP